jgi:DNA-binding NarL/FixJ family response regulator
MSKPIRVLLADDHAVLREGLKALLDLETDICVVAMVDNGRAAVREAARLAPDVVVIDISMPELNGIDAARQLVAEPNGPRVLFLSVHQEAHLVAAALRAGASGYVPKTVATEELVAAVRTIAAGRSYLSPTVTGSVLERYVRGTGDEYPGAYDELTEREREILQLIAEGHDTKAIASRLFISPKTVLSHRERLMRKLGLTTPVELARYAIREGIVEL